MFYYLLGAASVRKNNMQKLYHNPCLQSRKILGYCRKTSKKNKKKLTLFETGRFGFRMTGQFSVLFSTEELKMTVINTMWVSQQHALMLLKQTVYAEAMAPIFRPVLILP